MKKIITFLLLIFTIINVSAILYAGDRLVLIERFTSSTCPPCGYNNPIMDPWLHSQDPDRIIGLSYHMNWPAPDNDPMYWYNVGDNNGRRNFYAVNSIPQAFMDGIVNIQPNYSASALTTYFNSRTNIPTPITIVVTDSTFGDSVSVKARIYCEVVLSNPSVFVNFAVMEKHVTNISPPATNGETEFWEVFRKGLPNFSGVNLIMQPGHTYNLEQRYKMDPVWHSDQIQNVVFVQGAGEEILSAAQQTLNFTLIPSTPYASVYQGQNQSADYQVQVPSVTAGYNSAITLTASIDPPASGINVTFPSGNVISSYPGSANVHVTSTSSVPANAYRIIITGTNTNGKVHNTSVGYLVGKNYISVNSNRPGNSLQFKVDNVSFTSLQFYTWDLNASHMLTAVTPQTFASTRYVFSSWSDGGAESHNVNITPQTGAFVVNYGVQYKLITSMAPAGIGATISGGNIYYDSSSAANLSISPVQLQYNNQTWYFQRWQGSGNGSYTGPLPGVQLNMNNVIVETAQWDTIAPIGIINIGNGIPKTYSLHQNYPNPFNPVTKIKFDIPKSGIVSIKLYDILGNETATLFEGPQNAGYYEAEFDASNYASGIYFYKITAGSYSETKKMILIK